MRPKPKVQLLRNVCITRQGKFYAPSHTVDQCTTLSREETRLEYYKHPKIWKQFAKARVMPKVSFSSEEAYVGGLSLLALTDLLWKIAPKCVQCFNAKLHLCLERCCSTSALYCIDCESRNHFLHRTNELRLLFSNPEQLTSSQMLFLSKLLAVIEKSQLAISQSQRIIYQERESIASCVKLISEAQSEIAKLHDNIWHEEVIRMVNEAADENVDFEDLEAIKKQVQSAMQKINLHFSPELPASLTEGMVNIRVKHVSESMLNIAYPTAQETTIEKYLENTAFHTYIEGTAKQFANERHRARTVTSVDLQLNFMGNRLKINDNYTSQNLSRFRYLRELTIACELDAYPPQLSSLKISKLNQVQNIVYLPQELKSLRIHSFRKPLKHSQCSIVVVKLGTMEKLRSVELLRIAGQHILYDELLELLFDSKKLRTLILSFDSAPEMAGIQAKLQSRSRQFKRAIALAAAMQKTGYLRFAPSINMDCLLQMLTEV